MKYVRKVLEPTINNLDELFFFLRIYYILCELFAERMTNLFYFHLLFYSFKDKVVCPNVITTRIEIIDQIKTLFRLEME